MNANTKAVITQNETTAINWIKSLVSITSPLLQYIEKNYILRIYTQTEVKCNC